MTKKSVNYKASIKILSRTYEAKGKTIPEALNKLKVPTVRALGILTVSRGKESKERILHHFHVAKMFNTRGLSREVAINNISLMFEGV